MATLYHNIVGSSATDNELLAPGAGISGIRSITITNTHATDDASFGLFIQDAPTDAVSSTFKLLNRVVIPPKVTLLLDDASMLSFDNSKYGLYARCVSGDTLDVLINT
jgi:hypothetical protein